MSISSHTLINCGTNNQVTNNKLQEGCREISVEGELGRFFKMKWYNNRNENKILIDFDEILIIFYFLQFSTKILEKFDRFR